MLKVFNQISINTMHELSNCACVCLCWACADASVCSMWCMGMQQKMHEVCLEGLSVCNKSKVCETHNLISKQVITNSNQWKIQKLEFTGIQFSTKMSLRHSIKHLVCNREHQLWAMHEHDEIVPKYKNKQPQRPNTRTNQKKRNSTQSNLERNLHRNENPNPISKNPQMLNPNSNFSIIWDKWLNRGIEIHTFYRFCRN